MKQDLSTEDAAAILEILGSGSDPIWYRNVEYYVSDLVNDPAFFTEEGIPKWATRLQIKFFGGRSYRAGTLADMLLERLGCPHRATRTKNPRVK